LPVFNDPVVDNSQEALNERPDIAVDKMMNFRVSTKIDSTNTLFSLSWDIDVTREFDVTEHPVPLRDEDHLHGINREIPAEWYLKVRLKPSVFWESIEDRDARTYCSVIQSWFYEAILKLFVIKRREGCQYLTPMRKHFNSLSESDLIDLGKKKLVNITNDQYADYFARKIHMDYLMRFNNDEFDKSKLFIKPRSLKRVTREDGTVEFVQRSIKCMKTVPAHKWPQDVLQRLDNWEIDKVTGEAKMYADKGKKVLLLRINDPMQVVNLSRGDQRRLYDTECSFIPFWLTEENRYRKILRICLHEQVHADSRRLLFDAAED